MTASLQQVPGMEHSPVSAAEQAKICLVEARVRAELNQKTYGGVVRKLNEVDSWGRKGLLDKYEQAMLWDRIPLPWRVRKYNVGGICLYCGHDTSPDFPGPIMRTNHRGKEVKKSDCGYCQICGEDQYVKQIVMDEEFKRWKGMRVVKLFWPLRFFRSLLATLPLINLIKIPALEGTRIETKEGLLTTGRPYRDSERMTTADMTFTDLLELQAYHLNKAWQIGQHIQKNRESL